MKRILLTAMATAMVSASSAMAADLPTKAPRIAEIVAPSPWDWAFGGALMSDYNFRGISQSNRGPSVTVYSETRYNVNSNWQLYAGQQYWAVTLPTNPTCECDIYAGIRPTLGPLAFDFGAIYYWYPKERQHAGLGPVDGFTFPAFPNGNSTLRDTDYIEGYGKVVWDVVKDRFAVGGNFYYSPDWLGTGAYGAFGSVTAKFTGTPFRLNIGLLDEIGWYVSGEVGHYWLGTTDVTPFVFPTRVNLPDYTTWNVGLAFTWKVATIDLRYYDTDLSKANCSLLTGDPNAILVGGVGQSKWCGASFIVASKFDLTLSSLK